MSKTFSEMPIAEPLQKALAALNITTPTPVQAEVVAKAIEGGDWMVSSQTGSGKTFGFLLPVMHRMMDHAVSPMDNLNGPETLVLCPTRELAQQVSQDAITLVKFFRGLRIALVVGGMPYGKQMAGLRGARLVVGTPGRLLDLARSGKLNLAGVENLIVDEADRMLDLGFSDDLKDLSKLCKARAQTLMFSATFAKHVLGLAHSIMNEPTRIELAPSNETNTDIAQKLHWTDGFGHKRKILEHWLAQPEIDQAVIFTSTQQDAETLARDLGDGGHRVCALHGAMPQVVRNRRLNSIRKGDVKILVATDVAARGLDVPAISHVFNFGMPMKAEDYVHRIGRTGRAGRSGVAVTLAGADDRAKVRAIEKFISAAIPVETIAGLEPRPMPEKFGKKPSSNRRNGSGKPSFSKSAEGRKSWGSANSNGGGNANGSRTRSRPAQEVKPANERRRTDSGKPSFAKPEGRKPVRSSGFNSDRDRGGFTRKRAQ